MANCIERVAKQTGLSEEKVAEIVDIVEEKRAAYIASGAVDDPRAFLDHEIAKLAFRERNKKLRQKFDAYNNIIKKKEIQSNFNDIIAAAPKKGLAFKTKPVKEAWQALFFGSHLRVPGARRSIQSLRNGVFNDWSHSFMSEANKLVPGVRKLLKSKDFNDDIIREIREPLSTGNIQAREIGKLISKYSEIIRETLNKEGAFIGKIDGWTPQSHDRFKLNKVGEKVWVADQMGYLDLEATFPGVSTTEAERILSDVYQTIVTGVSDTAEIPGFKVAKNLAAKMAKNRVFHYKDADSVIAYNNKYGRGTIFESIMGHMNRSSRNYALLNKLGTNPELMVKKILQEQRVSLKKTPGGEKSLKEIAGDFDKREGTVGISFAEASGETQNPINLSAAQIGNGLRAWQSLAKLGGATLSATADIYINAMNIRFRGQNMFEAWFSAFRQYTAGLGDAEVREIAHAMGYGYEGMISSIASRFDPDAGHPGQMSSMLNIFFKASGLNFITETGQMGASHQLSGRLAYLSPRPFSDLGQMGEVFKLHGINSNDWEVLRKAVGKFEDGKEFILPDNILKVDNSIVEKTIAKDYLATLEKSLEIERRKIQTKIQTTKKNIAKQNILKRTLESQQNKKRISGLESELKNIEQKFQVDKTKIIDQSKKDLRRRYFAFVSDEIDTSIISSDDRTRAALLQGTKPGTVKGEILRSMAQFKAFPWTFQQRFLKSQRWNNKGINSQDKTGAAFLIANTLLFGYAAMTLKDIAKGNTPRDPNKPETWLKAATQGGGAGIYGDFIFAKHNRFGGGVVDTLAGPLIGAGANAVNLFQDLYRGDASAADAIYTGLNNTPYVNMWYTRAALDYTIMNHIRDAVSPGSRERQEKKYNKEFGGQRWFDKLQN